jgi:hypothetical protein
VSAEAVETLTPRRALELVASYPGGEGKTPKQLRVEAQHFEKDAERRDRLTVSRTAGTRRSSRVMAAARKAAEQRANAKVVTLAAREIERRKAQTAGEALRNPVMRFLRRAPRSVAGVWLGADGVIEREDRMARSAAE